MQEQHTTKAATIAMARIANELSVARSLVIGAQMATEPLDVEYRSPLSEIMECALGRLNEAASMLEEHMEACCAH